MENKSSIAEQIKAKYPGLSENIKTQRDARVWVKVPYCDFREFLEFAAKELKVDIFCMLTGLDDRDNYSFIYHMAHLDGFMLNIETSIPKSEPLSVKTVTDMYPSAELQEREIQDLLGVKIEGLQPGRRYPLPDDWPEGEYPLRKGWTVDRLNKDAGETSQGGQNA